jgi:hypothetical protein
MPVVLIIAFAASLGAHALALFGPDIDLSTVSEPPLLVVELKTPPAPPPLPLAKSEAKAAAAKDSPIRAQAVGDRLLRRRLCRAKPIAVGDPCAHVLAAANAGADAGRAGPAACSTLVATCRSRLPVARRCRREA